MSILVPTIKNVTISFFGRIKPSQKQNDPQIDRGVATNGKIGKFFINHFGSGTIKVEINNSDFYMNRASAFRLLHGKLKKSSSEYQNFKNQSNASIVAEIQAKFNGVINQPIPLVPQPTPVVPGNLDQITRLEENFRQLGVDRERLSEERRVLQEELNAYQAEVNTPRPGMDPEWIKRADVSLFAPFQSRLREKEEELQNNFEQIQRTEEQLNRIRT